MFERLICDEANCDHAEPIDDLTEDLIGKECPKCGANLLTREDYEAGMKIFAVKRLMEAAGLLSTDPDATGIVVHVNPHAGAVNMRIAPKGTAEMDAGK